MITINGKEVVVTSLEVEGVKRSQHPEYPDAFFSAGRFTNGEHLTDSDLNDLLDSQGELLLDIIFARGGDSFSF
jgi:hypothetical protein